VVFGSHVFGVLCTNCGGY